MSKLEVGDICVTQNNRVSLLNNGLLVEIIAIYPISANPYLVRRIDGHRAPVTEHLGVVSFFACDAAWTTAHRLRRVDPEATPSYAEDTERLTEHA